MKRLTLTVMLLLILGGQLQAQRSGESEEKFYWTDAMAEVHSKFTGQIGTFAHFGDSITVTMAFWTPLLYSRKNARPTSGKNAGGSGRGGDSATKAA